MFLFSFHSPFYDFQKKTTSYYAFGLVPEFLPCKALWYMALQQFYFFYPKVREIITASLFIHTSGHALKEEQNNSVEDNLKLSKIVFMIWQTFELLFYF